MIENQFYTLTDLEKEECSFSATLPKLSESWSTGLIIFQATFVVEEYLVYLHGSYEESGQVYIAIYILGYFLQVINNYQDI